MPLSDSSSSRPAYARPRPGAAFRLFCFPYAGGGASAFNDWAEHFAREVDVCAIHLPGREGRLREPPHTRLGPQLDELAQALAPYCETPFAFFGHCMGGLIAFELARRLAAASAGGPAHLFISGHAAPHLRDGGPGIHDLPEPDFVNRLRQQEAAPDFILADEELRSLFLPILRADFALCETYDYRDGEPLSCPISVFGGLSDPRVKREGLRAWGRHTQGAFTCRLLPGGHMFLHSARGLLLRLIAQDLRGVRRKVSPRIEP